MTAERLIELLQQMKPDTVVKAFDADSNIDEPITGAIYDQEKTELILMTDDNS